MTIGLYHQQQQERETRLQHHHHHHHHHHRRRHTDPLFLEQFCKEPSSPESPCMVSTISVINQTCPGKASLSLQLPAMPVLPSSRRRQVQQEQLEDRDDVSNVSTRTKKNNLTRQDLLNPLLQAIRQEDWNHVEFYLEQDATLCQRQDIKMICQGESLECSLIHLLAGTKNVPLYIVDRVVAVAPALLKTPTATQKRLPIHLAMIKGASHELVQYLAYANPQSLRVKDVEGNLPLHLACLYSSSATIQLLVQMYPDACQVANWRDRQPLHLVCSRCYSLDTIQPQVLQTMIQAYPQALQVPDRFGRMPLHLACQVQNVQCDLLKVLMEGYPQALVQKDKARLTPLCLLAKKERSHHHDEDNDNDNHYDLVLQFLVECTLKERRKQNPYLPTFLLVPPNLLHHNQNNKKKKKRKQQQSQGSSTCSSTTTTTIRETKLDNCYG